MWPECWGRSKVDIDKTKIIKNPARKLVSISVKLPESMGKFMKENKYSPTAIMVEALKSLGWKEESIETSISEPSPMPEASQD